LVLACLAVGPASAKSLYLIANINASPSPISTYDIQPAPAYLAFQATQTIPARAGGAVGLAIDTENRKLFVTYEGSNVIQLVDAVNFADLGTTTAPGASNLAGLVVDQGKGKLYAVDRNTNHLYVYSWDSATNTLTLDGGNYVTLAGVSSAHGLALDESRSRLYIGDNLSTTVRYYSTDGWGIEGSHVLTTTAQTPMGIAIDSRRNLLYMGNAYPSYGSLRQLVKVDLATGTESIYTLPTSFDNIVGVAVDEDTGNVYVTTGNQGSGGSDTVLAFDRDLNVLKDDLGDLGDPTGIAIPRTGISYNPLNFTKTAGANPVPNGADLTYELCYDNLANEVGATNVTITDTVPDGATLVSASGPSAMEGNVVTWTIGPVAGNASQACYDLVVNVTAAAGSQLFNSATITGTFGGSTVPTSQTVTSDVIGGYKPLTETMTESEDPVPSATNLIYTTCVGYGENTLPVTNVQLNNPIPAGTAFVSASGGGVSDGSTVTWSLGTLDDEVTQACVDLTLMVTAPAGSQLSNSATVTSDVTSPLTVSETTDVTSNYEPLAITYDDGVETVRSGSELTLDVCYDNTANELPVTGVMIRGLMPDGTTYVSNTGPGTYDTESGFVTWTIGDVAAGAPEVCYQLVVDVVAEPGENVSGGMVLTSNEVQPSSSANHTTAGIEGLQTVVIHGKGEGGGGAVGWLELLLGAGAAGTAALRRRRGLRRTAVAALLAAAAVGAQAAEAGWYAGAGYGQMNARASAGQLASDLNGLGYTAQVTLDDTDTGWKIVGGYRFSPWLAVEAGYVDLGEVSSVINASVLDVDQLATDVSRVHPWAITGVSLSGVASYPIGDFSLFAKLGAVRWSAEALARVVPAGTPQAKIEDKGTGLTYGLGADYNIPNTAFTVRAEWERFQTRRNDPEFWSLSLMYRF
jgi:uncharacterized repeat protein (TIGR01451 family)